MGLAVLSMIGALVAQAPPSGTGDRAVLAAVRDAFLTNVAAFPHGRVRFGYTQGDASDERAARAGEFTTEYRAEGLYVFSGELARYEILFPESELRRGTTWIDNETSQSILSSFRIATDGRNTLEDSIGAARRSGISRSVRLKPGRADFDREFSFPLAPRTRSASRSVSRGTGPRGYSRRAETTGSPRSDSAAIATSKT